MAKKRYIIRLIAGIAIAGVIFLPGYSKLQELRSRERELTDEIARLEEENKKLGEENKKLENDMFYIEKTARKEMGIAREGETIYKVVPSGKGEK